MNGKIKAVLLLAVMYGLGAASGIAWQRYRFHRFPNGHMMFADRRLKRLGAQQEKHCACRDMRRREPRASKRPA